MGADGEEGDVVDGGYELEFRWKEEVIYWEGRRGFVFDGGWGTSPVVTFVPDETCWNRVVPDWLQGRRDEIVARLAQDPSHVIESDPGFDQDPGREVTR